MANITIASTISPIFVDNMTEIRTQIAGAGGLANGQSVYTDPTTGTSLPTDGTSSSKVAFRGIVTGDAVGAGQAANVVERGYVAGYDLSALAFDALVYVSDTTGRLSTTAGTNSSILGRVAALSDRDPSSNKPSKVLFIRPSSI